MDDQGDRIKGYESQETARKLIPGSKVNQEPRGERPLDQPSPGCCLAHTST